MATKNSWNNEVADAAVTLNGGVVSIGTDAAGNAINIGTGAAARTVTIGNTTGATQVDVTTGTGGASITTAANANITLTPGGTGVVSVTTAPIVPTGDRAASLGSATNSWDNVYADGVTFDDGTNILATFVDKTAFTPYLKFGGNDTGITYGIQTGYYSRIGNVVTVVLFLSLTNKGTSTGNATITGMPVASVMSSPAAAGFGSVTYTGMITARISTSTLYIDNTIETGSSTTVTNTSFANTSSIGIAVTYIAA